ncbi:MAG: cache domain-containing protein, partial [bacterium]|nr:cache domain-containing protein [bacterium]
MKNICLRFSILLLVFSTIASGVLGVWYVYQTYTVIPAYQKKLLSIAQQRVRDVDAYLSQKKEYLRSLAHEIKIIEFMQNPQEEKTIQSFIQSHEITSRFENIILIKPDGNVIFSNKDPKKFKINVTDYAYRSMSLFLSFDRTIKTMTTDVAVFSFDMLLKIPTLYASMPIFNAEKVFIGVISAQFHVDELYTIINNYFDLGKTGDIFIVKQVKNGAQIIAPTRNDPHSSFTIIEFQGKNVVIPLERAVQGQDGATTTLDHQGQKVVAAWSYIPLLAWGIAITINYDEASEPIRSAYRWWFTSLLFIFAIIMLIVILQWQRITQWTKTHIVKHPINLVICALIIMLIIGTSYLVYRYRNLRNEAITQAHQQAEQKVAYTVQQLQQELQNIKQRALAIAEDLSKDRLKKEDIAIRMRRDI